MRTRLPLMIAGLGFVSALVVRGTSGIGWAADTAAEEQTLEKKASNINSMPASPKHDEARAQALAKQFNVPESRVTELRNQKMGWGEITISLAMAEHLAATSKTPMTTEQALAKIEQLRSEKMGWGRIAKDLSFKLGPVVSKVEQSEKTVRTADHEVAAEGAEHKSKGDQPEKVERPDKGDRQDRAGRAERSARPERPGR